MESEFSGEVAFMLGSLPSKPVAPTKDILLSKAESIYVKWNKITTDTLMILGYNLYADSGRRDSDLRLVFSGVNYPQLTSFAFDESSNLGELVDFKKRYRFQLEALNFNGAGPRSEIVELQSCTLPSLFSKPAVYDISSSQISVSWSPPELDGGCPVTSYHIYILGTTWSEIDSLAVSNKPLLTQYDINMAAYIPGGRLAVRMGV